jgi:O-antigen/teichoic acid export membrane protein
MSREPDPTQDDRPSYEMVRELDGVIVRSVGWLGLSLGGSQALSVLSMLILARLLEPKAFGLVAVAWIIIGVLQELQDSGMASALIYRRKDIERAAGSALVFAPVTGLVLCGLGAIAAPYLAHLIGDAHATNVIRTLLLVVLIRSFSIAPWAILERNMNYKAKAKIDFATASVQAIVAIGLAFSGAGVWSLVVGQLSGTAAGVAVVWLLVPWRPSPRQADFRILRELLRYGRWVGSARSLNVVNRTLDNFVVARLLGTTSLGFYALAFRLADMPVSLLGGILGRVMFPVYSLLQDDLDSVRRVFVQYFQRVALVLLPISVGLLIDAKPIVLALLGEKWLSAVTPLQILAVWALVRSFVSPSGSVFDGRGKPHLALFFLVPGTGVLLLLLLLLVPRFGVSGAAAAQAIAISTIGIPSLLLALRMIQLSPLALARAIGPSALCSAVLAATLLLLTGMVDSLTPVLALLALVSTGLAVYLVSTAIFARSVIMPMWWSIRGTRGQPT